ncbi:MAG: peptide ABC transporter ATP-binding protein [miscellaneous Crenarchaeota group-6 archaeon AD8-1]|nr:MAG: peptide ABC transporter ATP-binding protein [miscellaneous Crenarchaeota group-6 archaeon AD8-1]
MNKELLRIEGLKTYFDTWAGIVKAVDGVDIEVIEGETLGLVGESGSGKSVTALSIMRIVPSPGKIIEGKIIYKEENLLEKSEKALREIRGKEIAYIFQDPSTSLNPVLTIADQLLEVILAHQEISKKEALEKAIELLKLVEIPDPDVKIWNYPHQLSGGMKQRIAIARAIASQPNLLLADEPTTNLDVTIQAQILELMQNLRKRLGMAMILITHDMGVVADIADRITVLYAGRVCESADTKTIFYKAKHPYTQALLTAVPSLALRTDKLKVIPGNIPNLIEPPSGCRFHPRCEYAIEKCTEKIPELIEIEPGHKVACFRALEINLESPLGGAKNN